MSILDPSQYASEGRKYSTNVVHLELGREEYIGTNLNNLLHVDFSAPKPGFKLHRVNARLNIFSIFPDRYQVYEMFRNTVGPGDQDESSGLVGVLNRYLDVEISAQDEGMLQTAVASVPHRINMLKMIQLGGLSLTTTLDPPFDPSRYVYSSFVFTPTAGASGKVPFLSSDQVTRCDVHAIVDTVWKMPLGKRQEKQLSSPFLSVYGAGIPKVDKPKFHLPPLSR